MGSSIYITVYHTVYHICITNDYKRLNQAKKKLKTDLYEMVVGVDLG